MKSQDKLLEFLDNYKEESNQSSGQPQPEWSVYGYTQEQWESMSVEDQTAISEKFFNEFFSDMW